MRLLIDADLILEFFMNRRGYIEKLEMLLNNLQCEEFEAYITSWCIKKIQAYTLATHEAEEIMATLEILFNVINVDQSHIRYAQTLPIRDPESAIEVACASDFGIGAVLTHNPQNFAETTLRKLSIDELLQRQPLERMLEAAPLSLGQLFGKIEGDIADLEVEIDRLAAAINGLRKTVLESGNKIEGRTSGLLHELVGLLDRDLTDFREQVTEYRFNLSKQIFIEKSSWFSEEVTVEQNHIFEQTALMEGHVNCVNRVREVLLNG